MLNGVALGPEPHVAGQLVRVFECLLEQCVAGLEVVVDQRVETPASMAIRAIRTSSMPSLAIRSTAAAR